MATQLFSKFKNPKNKKKWVILISIYKEWMSILFTTIVFRLLSKNRHRQHRLKSWNTNTTKCRPPKAKITLSNRYNKIRIKTPSKANNKCTLISKRARTQSSDRSTQIKPQAIFQKRRRIDLGSQKDQWGTKVNWIKDKTCFYKT